MTENWISDRARAIDLSVIRQVFELGRSLKNPVNLSIGQPHFPVPTPIKVAAKAAIDADRNGYSVSQGIGELNTKIKNWLDKTYGHTDRAVFLTSGTSGGLHLVLAATVNPGDEVIIFDPYFVGYPGFIELAGGRPLVIDTYPDFGIDVDKVRSAITPKTKVILFNSPANPSGAVPKDDQVRDLALLAAEKNILLISDEIYRNFCYDRPFISPAKFNSQTLVVDGFGKTYGFTGWRLGFAHGPSVIIEQMIKLQQLVFVNPPSIVQYGGVAAWDHDTSAIVADYRQKRDRLAAGLKDRFEFAMPGGAFYLFPKVPWGTGTAFVEEATKSNLL